jgi:hypothetical protein
MQGPSQHPLPNEPVLPLARRLFAEGLGTAILLATVVGSGIMAERLAVMSGLGLGAGAPDKPRLD